MVKKLRFLLILCFILHSFLSFSQHFALGIDALHGAYKQFKPSIEGTVGNHFSVLLNYESGIFAQGISSDLISQSIVYELNGKAIMPSIRYYPFTKRRIAPKGLSVELYYRHFWFTETYNGDDFSVSRDPLFFFNPVQANVNTKGTATNVGLAIAYKFTLGPIVVEPLLGYGTYNGEWDSPNERNKIDPFFTEKNDLVLASRIEIKVGFYFPQIKRKNEIPFAKNKIVTSNETLDSNTSPANEIKLYIYRPKIPYEQQTNYDVKINDSLIVNIKSGTFEVITFNQAGEYIISAKVGGEKSIKAPLEAGKTYYLRCGVRAGLFTERPKFKFVKPVVGKTEIGYLKIE